MSKKLGLLILSLVLAFCTGCATNPITGQEEFMLYPEQWDLSIGRQAAPEVEKELGGRIENEALQSYVNSVGQQLARVSHKPGWEFHFVALNHKSINALALPGGHIFITKGLLDKLTTEAQLAAILGHEIGHVVARDSAAALSRATAISLLFTAVMSESTPEGAQMAANLARLILDLRYSRTDEREADLAGLDYTVWAGYNPYGAVETMQMLEKLNTERPIEFFSTHPDPGNRKAYLTQKIQMKYYNLEGLKVGKEDYRSSILQQLSD